MATGPVPDEYFLSAINPRATADQRDLENLALRIGEMPAVVAGRQQAAQRWKTIVGRDMTPEASGLFDRMIEEWAFAYTLKAVNDDPNYPRIVEVFAMPHEWFGRKVPGSRSGGGPGTDHRYLLIPVAHGPRYELSGQQFDSPPGHVVYTLSGNISLTMTLGNMEGHEIETGPDGRFTITLDPTPADGRRNHIQTRPGSRYLFIRDCFSDWRQVPNALRIRRLDPPAAPPLTEAQMAERAAQLMIDDVPHMYWFMRVFAGLEPNTITPPFNTGGIGGLVTQAISFAHLHLADDEAFVATLGSGGAAFRDLVLHDYWFNSLSDYARHTSNMNNTQGIPNPDGTTTYVISIRDTGVHNWLDPIGLHELLVVHRWQGMAPDTPPTASGKLVKLSELAEHLPPGMKKVTPAEREQQLGERLATHKLRFVDC